MYASIILSGQCSIGGANDTVNANGLNGGILDNQLKSKAFCTYAPCVPSIGTHRAKVFLSYAPCAPIDRTYRCVNQRRWRTLMQTRREHAKSAQKG